MDFLISFTCALRSLYTRFEVFGEWAFERGTYTINLTSKAGGAPMEDIGKYLNDLPAKTRRQLANGPRHLEQQQSAS